MIAQESSRIIYKQKFPKIGYVASVMGVSVEVRRDLGFVRGKALRRESPLFNTEAEAIAWQPDWMVPQ